VKGFGPSRRTVTAVQSEGKATATSALECHDPCAVRSLADVAVSSVPSSFNPALSGCCRSDDGGALSLLGGGALLLGGVESEVGAPLWTAVTA
jgi:hypothetical protein